MAVNYILCAAGSGQRFKNVSVTTPKPLIRLQNKTLLEWSIESLPYTQEDRLIVITQKEHNIRETMKPVIEKLYAQLKVIWIELETLTRGQLETALLAESHLDLNSSTVIYNSDTYFESGTLLKLMANPTNECIIPCSQEKGDSWSFCRIGENDTVLEVKEKVRISEWASVGFYYFKNTPLLITRTKAHLAQPATTEYYVAPLYNEYIEAHEQCIIDRLSVFKPMGTPEQIKEYWGISV